MVAYARLDGGVDCGMERAQRGRGLRDTAPHRMPGGQSRSVPRVGEQAGVHPLPRSGRGSLTSRATCR